MQSGFTFGQAVHPVDINNDGNIDILSSTFTSSDWFWYDNADGTGLNLIENTVSPQITGATAFDTGLFNDDLFPDVVLAMKTVNQVVLHINTGVAPFIPDEFVFVDRDAPGVFDVAVGELTGDGIMDIVSICETDNSVRLYTGDSSGGFTTVFVDETLAMGRRISVADLDGQGGLDLLAVGHQDVFWYANNGTGSFTKNTILLESDQDPTETLAVDIDHDGDNDILVLLRTGDRVLLFRNDGGG